MGIDQNLNSQKNIIVEDLTVTYRNGHTALRSASFKIPEGSIAALVGVNGAGKSTLFKALMGFIPSARGKISLLGYSCLLYTSPSPRDRTRSRMPSSA